MTPKAAVTRTAAFINMLFAPRSRLPDNSLAWLDSSGAASGFQTIDRDDRTSAMSPEALRSASDAERDERVGQPVRAASWMASVAKNLE